MSETAVALVMVLVAVPGFWALMWLGWRARRRRQAGLAPLPAVPEQRGTGLLDDVEATYVTSTFAGQQLERVVPYGLGVPSAAVVRVSTGGVLLDRRGAPAVWVPAGALRGARLQRGIIGKVVDAEGLVVLEWEHAGTRLDTGLRLRYEADRQRLLDAVAALTGPGKEQP